MDFDADILKEFVSEAREHFDTIEEEFLTLYRQKDTPDRKLIDKIFRSIHSTKGAAGFLQLNQISKLSHVMESILSKIRDGEMKPQAHIINALLAGVDRLKLMLKDVEQSETVDISDVHERLISLMETMGSPDIRSDIGEIVRLTNFDESGTEFQVNRFVLKNLPANHKYFYILKYDLVQFSKSYGKSPVVLIRDLRDSGEIITSMIQACTTDISQVVPKGPLKYIMLYSTYLTPGMVSHLFDVFDKDILVIDRDKLLNRDSDTIVFSADSICPVSSLQNMPSAATEQPVPMPDEVTIQPPVSLPNSAAPLTERSDIRVDLEKLDVLINLVGELVMAESMVTNSLRFASVEPDDCDHSIQNLRRVISDLQDVSLSMRMIPLSKTFRKSIRLLHDLSEKMGKQIKVNFIGEETEVDKTVIEHIADPLVHIIRNCVDHGIESLEERKAAGKSEIGTITIEAKHEGGEVLIRISDDGRGLDREKILRKAIELGLVKGDTDQITDKDIIKLVFEAGLSTANKITDVSGRGVGMDVVKRNIEKMKGKINIQSIPGKGTSILLRIPLTLAIIEGMLIRVGTSNYTIPMLSILESFRPEPHQITVTMDGEEIIKVRDELLPVIRLHRVYNIVPIHTELDKGILINVSSGNRRVCLFADEIVGHHQTVIKGMPGYMASVRGVSGCTILGNGEISLILDVGSIEA